MQKSTSLGESMNTTSKKIKIECQEVPIVNIPSKIFSDIYYLHSKYQGKEWSGHIYFEKVGDINEPSTLVINVKDFILLDLGTAGATEIDPTGEQVISMYEKRPHILSMKSGLIHTHHNMNTFFSGTDWDTLLENAANYDFFLSVIVNNAGDTIAKISLQGFIEEPQSTHTYKYKFNRGYLEKEIIYEKKSTEVIYVYTCKINIENTVEEELNNLLKIKEEKSKQLALTNRYNNIGVNRTFSDDWDWTENKGKKLNPQYDVNFKTKPHKQPNQLEMFDKGSILDQELQRPSIKDLTITFLTSLILQDDDLELTFSVTYAQAIEAWNEEVGIEMEKEFKDYVKHIIPDVFENIFGDEVSLQEYIDIEANVNIIMGNSIPELAIKPIILEFINSR